jgi:excisionase family DNA binding protein
VTQRSEALEAAAVALAAAADALRRAARAEADDAPSRLLSVEDAAERLGVSRATTYGLITSGALVTHKIGRRRLVSEAALADYVIAGRETRDGTYARSG